MSSTPDAPARPLTFRRYKDGDHRVKDWQAQIFDADHSHKCPTYIQSTPPCQGSCPSGEDIRGYLNIVRGIEKPPAGMPWQEYAWRRLTEANPLPSVMGRVCPAPCESGCNRNQVEDFVGINSVEHFLGEYAIEHGLAFPKPAQSTGKKVAVIGGGPAGLSAAYQLARKGHAVTIFDERAELGGMMRYGIPGFRTPRTVLDAEIRRILDLGVATRMSCRIGSDVTLEQIKAEFDASKWKEGPAGFTPRRASRFPYVPFWLQYASSAVRRMAASVSTDAALPLSPMPLTEKTTTAARMPRIVMTTRSSMSVKPLSRMRLAVFSPD